MHVLDSSYVAIVGLAGAILRGVRRGLPAAWRLRLEALPPEDLEPGWIWVHAVSVGELLLAEGLLGRMRDAGHRIHVTTGTPAGLELLSRRLPDWDAGAGRVSGGAFPLDDPAGLRPFLKHPPGAFVALETELWPNLLRTLESRAIPRMVVNGRLTARTLRRGGPWLRRAVQRLSLVAARDEESLKAFQNWGAPWVELGGNLKADLPLPKPLHAGWQALREAWREHPVVVAGNTVEGEEALVLAAWRSAREAFPDLRLMLAPRQPKRFEAVATLLQSEGISFARASLPWPSEAEAWRSRDVLLLDTLGELAAAYGEGTVALVGGGWTWHGGHNPLEPVRYGLPTLIGPGFSNFEDLVLPLRDAGMLACVPTAALTEALRVALAEGPLRPSQCQSDVTLPTNLKGALDQTHLLIEKLLRTDRGSPCR